MHSSTERQRCSRNTAQVSFSDDLGREIQHRFRVSFFFRTWMIGRARGALGAGLGQRANGRTLELRLARGRAQVGR
jgi:hypothetical protein